VRVAVDISTGRGDQETEAIAFAKMEPQSSRIGETLVSPLVKAGNGVSVQVK
jgi:hypothetical protein